jgi:hypothetical protein
VSTLGEISILGVSVSDPGPRIGNPGGTGVGGGCGTVFGLDGLNTGACGGGAGFTNCACACSIAAPMKARHPARESMASVIRANLVIGIAVEAACPDMAALSVFPIGLTAALDVGAARISQGGRPS